MILNFRFVLSFMLVYLFCTSTASAQKFGYVDTDFVLNQIPEYKDALSEIDMFSVKWEKEIQVMFSDIGKLESALHAEEVLLTKEMREDRLLEIDKKWSEAKQYQKKIFGFEGLFFLKKKELIKPVQDKVFEAVERVAKSNKLQIVFDKSSDLVMLYTNPIHDYTDYVLEELDLGDKNDRITNN